MSLSRYMIPAGFGDSRLDANTFQDMKDKQEHMEDQLHYLQKIVSTLSADYAQLRDFCHGQVNTLLTQQATFQENADELRQALRTLKKNQKQDSARLNGFEAALNTAKTACAKSTSALRNIVIHAEGVLKNKREVLEKALYTLPDIETRLGSKIERLQLSVTVLQTNMQELKPRVESFENIALADHDLELRLSDLDEEVIRLHGTVQGVLLEIIELKVPHASLHSFQPVDQSADTDSSRGNKNVMQSLASELQTVDTNPKDQSALLDVGNLSLTSPSKYGEQGCHGRRRREGSVKDDLTAGVIVNDKAGITCGCSSDSEDTAISDKSILEERTILDHRQNDEIEHNFQRFSQEGQKYTFACALLLLIYLFDEYIVIYFSERPLFEQLRRMSTGTRQPVDSLIIDTLIVMLLHVLALQV